MEDEALSQDNRLFPGRLKFENTVCWSLLHILPSIVLFFVLDAIVKSCETKRKGKSNCFQDFLGNMCKRYKVSQHIFTILCWDVTIWKLHSIAIFLFRKDETDVGVCETSAK